MMERLRVLTTGGTIDKIYYDDKSDYQIGEPEIGRILTDMNVAFDWSVQSLMRKDSLHMTDDDRRAIRNAVAADDAGHFLITHGTDSMVDTARVLGDITGKVMVLTGALNPARFKESDAVFNIGFALAAAQTLPPGAYLTMNGQVFDPDHVRKNREANQFERM